MKNIVFDLGGVLFARDKSKCTPELLEFFSFLRAPRMPLFWEEYDRGTSTLEEVTATISGMTGRPVETCAAVPGAVSVVSGLDLRKITFPSVSFCIGSHIL